MKTRFKFYSDPSHGWVKVDRPILVSLGIIDKITPFSYQRGDFVYLEEDQDLSTFFNAFFTKYGKDPILVHMPQSNNRSRIINYQRFGRA